MYAMRIEDADHVTGNRMIGLQNIPAPASAGAAGDQERFIYRRCLNANAGRSTLTTDCTLRERACMGRDWGRDRLARRKLELWSDSDRQKEIRISQRMIRLISFRDETRETAD